MNQNFDRRKRRTRQAILRAFNELVAEGDIDDIRVPDIVARANVGRSTFYEHFANATDVYLTAFSSPLSILATTLAGKENLEDLLQLLEHFWQNRHRARGVFSGRNRERANHLLQSLIEQELATQDGEQRLLKTAGVVRLSEGALGLIRAWLLGELSCTAEELSHELTAGTQPCQLLQAAHRTSER